MLRGEGSLGVTGTLDMGNLWRTPFFATEGHGERQLQQLYPRRVVENCNSNFFVHGGPRRATENGNCNFSLSDGEGLC